MLYDQGVLKSVAGNRLISDNFRLLFMIILFPIADLLVNYYIVRSDLIVTVYMQKMRRLQYLMY